MDHTQLNISVFYRNWHKYENTELNDFFSASERGYALRSAPVIVVTAYIGAPKHEYIYGIPANSVTVRAYLPNNSDLCEIVTGDSFFADGVGFIDFPPTDEQILVCINNMIDKIRTMYYKDMVDIFYRDND